MEPFPGRQLTERSDRRLVERHEVRDADGNLVLGTAERPRHGEVVRNKCVVVVGVEVLLLGWPLAHVVVDQRRADESSRQTDDQDQSLEPVVPPCAGPVRLGPATTVGLVHGRHTLPDSAATCGAHSTSSSTAQAASGPDAQVGPDPSGIHKPNVSPLATTCHDDLSTVIPHDPERIERIEGKHPVTVSNGAMAAARSAHQAAVVKFQPRGGTAEFISNDPRCRAP